MSATRVSFTPRQLSEFTDLTHTLQMILLDVAAVWPGGPMEVTSIYRTAEEEMAANGKTGIHCAGPPYRAIDFRITGIGQVATDEVSAKINAKWQYDPARPQMVVAYSAPHGSGPHLHLQCHPSTTTRSDNTSAAGAALNT
jgi:hypothetical protein